MSDSNVVDGTGRIAFQPSAFVHGIASALVPLIEDGSDGKMKEGKGVGDIHAALVPIFGRFTIADAVCVHSFLRPAGDAYFGNDGLDGDRTHGVWLARESLVHFICHGMATGPACAAARAQFAQTHDGDGDALTDDLYRPLHFRISCDISALRSARYFGQRFEEQVWNERHAHEEGGEQ